VVEGAGRGNPRQDDAVSVASPVAMVRLNGRAGEALPAVGQPIEVGLVQLVEALLFIGRTGPKRPPADS
jgi:hypothetical protein